MANDQNPEYEVLHYGAWRFVTPFQEWHNERALARVPGRAAHDGEPARTNRGTAVLARRQRRLLNEFQEELLPLTHTETCGFGAARPVRICMCERGEHE
ncbi:hypothetical protein [Streptomyces beigongshangae]|uniref:hypothetical protein n=1 Tax=Streptomyces beigongshangae TaxID=2841597 RepID=UPI001C84F4C1|nr:hypothetical protein [Streptomyces sp. REN17]